MKIADKIIVRTLSSENEILLKWSEIPGSDIYEIYLVDNTQKQRLLYKTTSVIAKIGGLKPNISCTFLIKAIKTNIEENITLALSDLIYAAPLGIVENITARNSYGKCAVIWKAVDFADGYKVYKIEANGIYSEIANVTNNNADLVFENNISYKIKIRAYRIVNKTLVFSKFSDLVECCPTDIKIEISPDFLLLKNGDTKSISCLCEGKEVSAKWQSSDEKIAKINNKGEIIALSQGQCTVTASFGGATAAAQLSVSRKAENHLYPFRTPSTKVNRVVKTATLMIGGRIDFNGDEQICANKNGYIDFTDNLSYLKPILSKSDYSVCFSGSTFSQSNLYAYENDDRNGINAPSTCLDSIKNTGFAGVFSICDNLLYTADEIDETRRNIARYDLDNLGIYSKKNQPHYILKNLNGIWTAIFGYNLLSMSFEKRCGEENKYMFGGYSKESLESDISAVKSKGADYIIAIINWDASPLRMNEIATEMANCGVNLIVGNNRKCEKASTIEATRNRVTVFNSNGTLFGSITNGDSAVVAVSLSSCNGVTTDQCSYIPCSEIKDFDGKTHVVVPIFNRGENSKFAELQTKKADILSAIGEDIPLYEDVQNNLSTTSVRLIGSKLLNEIFNDDVNYTVDEKLINADMLTLFFPLEKTRTLAEETVFATVCDIEKSAFSYIKKNITDYLVIDLANSLLSPIYTINNKFYKADIYFENTGFYKNNKDNASIIEPPFPKDLWKPLIDIFIENLKYLYRNDKVILVKNSCPSLMAVNSQLKFNNDDEYDIEYINQVEEYFISKVKPIVIDISKHYFKGTDKSFEPDFYVHFKQIMNRINDSEKKLIYSLQNNDILISRYIKYQKSLLKQGFEDFLAQENYAVFSFMKKTSPDFVYKYNDEFTNLLKIKFDSIQEISSKYAFDNSSEVKKALELICKIENKDILGLSFHDFKVVFEYNFAIKKRLSAVLKGYFAEFLLAENLEIKNYSLEFYLRKLLEFIKTKDNKKIISECEAYEKLYQPVKIDVWGSEMTTECLLSSKHISVKNIIFRNPFICQYSKQIKYDESLLQSDKLLIKKPAEKRVLKNALDRNAKEVINQSDSQWIIVDFFDLAMDMTEVGGQSVSISSYAQYSDFYKKNCDGIFNACEKFSTEVFKTAIEKMIDFLKKKYGENIILNRVNLCSEYYDICGNRKPLNVDKNTLIKSQATISIWEKFFIQRTGCYVLNLTKNYISDETYPIGGAGMGSYEKQYYKNAGLCIEHIIRNKPTEKQFTSL